MRALQGGFDFTATRITRSIDESLARLGLDYVDSPFPSPRPYASSNWQGHPLSVQCRRWESGLPSVVLLRRTHHPPTPPTVRHAHSPSSLAFLLSFFKSAPETAETVFH
uniref:Uncharacterized protein n=1 Tax=Oryza punctata TaxID=4537 RepID=A0A0E0MKD9_ORYPU